MKDTFFSKPEGEKGMALELEPPEDELMEPLDFSTKRDNLPPAWGPGATPISPENHPHSTFIYNNNSPSYSDGSSQSPPLGAAMNPTPFRPGKLHFDTFIPDRKSPFSTSPYLRALATPTMHVSSSVELHSIGMLGADTTIIKRNRCKESPPTRKRTPTPVEKKIFVRSPSRLNLKSLETNSTYQEPFTEVLPVSTNPFPTAHQLINLSQRRDSSSSDDYGDHTSSTTITAVKKPRINEENAATNPLLMSGVNTGFSVQPTPLHPNLMHLQQTNPAFLSALYGILAQQKAAEQAAAATSSSLSLSDQPSNPQQIPQIPIVAPHLSMPTGVPSLLPIAANPYPPMEDDEDVSNATYLQFRAAAIASRQMGQRQRKAPASKRSQSPKEKANDEATNSTAKDTDTNNASTEDKTVSKPGNSKDGTVKDQAYWERRKKNNEAAKRSRDARRAKEDEVAVRAAFLENENMQLRMQLQLIKKNLRTLQAMHYFPKEPPTPALPGY